MTPHPITQASEAAERPLYYAEGNRVFKRPIARKIEGGQSITVGFPVCEATDYVNAEDIASVLDAGERSDGFLAQVEELKASLREMIDCGNAVVGADIHDPDAVEVFAMYEDARRRARAALKGGQ